MYIDYICIHNQPVSSYAKNFRHLSCYLPEVTRGRYLCAVMYLGGLFHSFLVDGLVPAEGCRLTMPVCLLDGIPVSLHILTMCPSAVRTQERGSLCAVPIARRYRHVLLHVLSVHRFTGVLGIPACTVGSCERYGRYAWSMHQAVQQGQES